MTAMQARPVRIVAVAAESSSNEAAKQEPAQLAVKASSKASPLRWFTSGSPTNYNMLLFRTLNHEMGHPHANADHLAPLLRDKLMPARMWWLKHAPGAWRQLRNALEHKKLGAPGVVNFVDARTKWFDQAVEVAVGQHGIQQVVVVAAGFDTRTYRFGARHPGVRFFEVDLPHASSKKQQLVQQLLQPESSYPRPTYIPADLSTVSLDQVLTGLTGLTGPAWTHSSADSSGQGKSGTQAGFDPSQPTLFTVEGLIYYLPQAAVQQLFASVLRVAAPGSRLAFDFLDKKVLEGSVPLPPAYKVTAQSVANKGEPFISGIDNSREAVAAFMANICSSAAAAAAAEAEAAQGAAEAGAGIGAAAGAAGSTKRFDVVEYMGPKDMLAWALPHLQWNDRVPPILSFYSYASVEVVV